MAAADRGDCGGWSAGAGREMAEETQMSAFEDGVDRLRNRRDRDDYEDGLLTVAEGLAEIIGLLRPLVEQGAAPGTSTDRTPCGHHGPVTDRGALGLKRHRCIKSMGHDGMHTSNLGVLW